MKTASDVRHITISEDCDRARFFRNFNFQAPVVENWRHPGSEDLVYCAVVAVGSRDSGSVIQGSSYLSELLRTLDAMPTKVQVVENTDKHRCIQLNTQSSSKPQVAPAL